MILALPGIEKGRAYGLPAFTLGGAFFARFRDGDSVLAIRLGSIADREVLMQLDPEAFFFTEHYRDYPAVLVRLAQVRRGQLASVLEDAGRQGRSSKSAQSRTDRRAGRGRAARRR
jgi:hypothetical protein